MTCSTTRPMHVAMICVCLLSGLSACSSQQVATTSAIKSNAAKHAEKRVVTSQEAIALAEAELNDASDENLSFFSPLHLLQAEESLSEARAFALNPTPEQPNAAIESALSSRAFIKKGLENKADVLVYLREAIAHKRMLQKLEVPAVHPERYQTVLYEFSKLIKLIEEGEPNQALNMQGALRDEMYALEIDTLVSIHLSEAGKILSLAQENDAERYAPKSFYSAQHKIATTDEYIRSNYRDRLGIKKSGEHALLLSKRVHEVTIASKNLMNLDSAGAEQYILDEVKRLKGYYTQLTKNELPPQSIERSAIDVKIAIKDYHANVQATEQKLAALEHELKRYTEVTTAGLNDAEDKVFVLETMQKQASIAPPLLNEDEQGFDSVEFVE